MNFVNVNTDSNPERFIPIAIPWIYSQGENYFEWLFDGPETAKKSLYAWMKHPFSQFSIYRMTFLEVENQLAGGFICIRGDQMTQTRKADTIALLNTVNRKKRQTFFERLDIARHSTVPVVSDDFYLRIMGLAPQYRGKGLGRLMLMKYLEVGSKIGFTRFRLDVEADNYIAIRLYESVGFQVLHKSTISKIDMDLLSMIKIKE